MKVFLLTDCVAREFEGKIYFALQVESILKRYFDTFGKFILCSRYEKVNSSDKRVPVDEYIEELISFDSLLKPISKENKEKIQKAIENCDLVIVRLHSVAVCRAYDFIKKFNKPIFAEIMGDTWDAYWNHGIKGKIIAPYTYFKTKKIVKKSDYALYVTSRFLQNRYPCENESIGVSNVKIPLVGEDVLENRLKKIENLDKQALTLTTTAAVDVKYKGHEYVIRAIPKLNKLGIRTRYVMVGSGDQSYLKKIAEKCGVLDQIEFKGRMSLDEVFTSLDKTDVYIQPSLQEGLPRSVIEAMSRGCPCIGARTAGIPELIEDNYVVKRKSINDIVDKVVAFCNSSVEEKKATAVRNFKESKNYLESVLNERRNAYYEKIKTDLKG